MTDKAKAILLWVATLFGGLSGSVLLAVYAIGAVGKVAGYCVGFACCLLTSWLIVQAEENLHKQQRNERGEGV